MSGGTDTVRSAASVHQCLAESGAGQCQRAGDTVTPWLGSATSTLRLTWRSPAGSSVGCLESRTEYTAVAPAFTVMSACLCCSTPPSETRKIR